MLGSSFLFPFSSCFIDPLQKGPHFSFLSRLDIFVELLNKVFSFPLGSSIAVVLFLFFYLFYFMGQSVLYHNIF